ncbi:MAG: hypothetical protein FWG40_10665 [Peptococcaceae bacterium]|nr:hypothetical protein [Peptococcaceae bacterium]
MKKKIIAIVLIIAALLMLAISLQNRIKYGVWDPFKNPDRVECFDRRYYLSNTEAETFEEIGPLYEITSPDNPTGKKLYLAHPKGPTVPLVIYLKTGTNSYQSYTLSGGP